MRIKLLHFLDVVVQEINILQSNFPFEKERNISTLLFKFSIKQFYLINLKIASPEKIKKSYLKDKSL